MNEEKTTETPDNLRRRAEQRLEDFSPNLDKLSTGEVRDLLYELRVHQAELEIQNEELRDTQARLENARREYYELYNLAPVGYLQINREGIIVQANLKMADLLNQHVNEIVGKSFFHYIYEPDRSEFIARFQAFFRRPHSKTHDLRLQPKDGPEFFIHLEGRIKPDPGSKEPLLLLNISDINELKKIESDLRRAKTEAEKANAVKSEFLASMSHEIRTPMNAIIGLTDLVLASEKEEEAVESLGLIKDSSQHLLAIINDILDFSKLEAGRVELRESSFYLPGMLNLCADSFGQPAREKGLEVSLKIAPDVPQYITSDEDRLRQVLFNLLGNAVKFTDSGSVQLEVSRAGENSPGNDERKIRLRFSVRDTGRGISATDQGRIFERFNRGEEDKKNTGPTGTGLGLSISRLLVKKFGGKLALTSSPGKGSDFFFTIPVRVAGAGQSPSEKPGELAATKHRRHILVADDNDVNIKLISKVLDHIGHQVTCVFDGQQALDQLRQRNDIELVFLDVEMPVRDGVETARAIRDGEAGDHYRNTPLVAMTAHVLRDMEDKCREAGMDGFITKPIQIHDLEEVIQKFANVKGD